MLSVPTLFLAFAFNFIAIALIWFYVVRSYPNFGAARFWAAASSVAAVAALLSLLRGVVHPAIPVLIGGGLFIFAGFLGAMGIQRLYDRPRMWRLAIAVTAISVISLAVFALWMQSVTMRILIYSVSQSIALVMVLPLLFSRENGSLSPGTRLTGYITLLCIAIYWVRPVAGLFKVGGEVTLIEFNGFQAGLLVMLVFSTMAWNFGFLLMAIDRLRGEVADLAMADDLTGAANRRQLLSRLEEECARSARTREPFALLMIDIDGFKSINDNFGHAAGDECLKLLARNVQTKLRSGDLLARLGGDEFCVVLPSTTWREASLMARRAVEGCRVNFTPERGEVMPLTASVGATLWRAEIGSDSAKLIAEADRALYAAKHGGKDCFSIFEAHAEAGRADAMKESAEALLKRA